MCVDVCMKSVDCVLGTHRPSQNKCMRVSVQRVREYVVRVSGTIHKFINSLYECRHYHHILLESQSADVLEGRVHHSRRESGGRDTVSVGEGMGREEREQRREERKEGGRGTDKK